MKNENREQFYEVITEQAVEISRLRKKCGEYDRNVTVLRGKIDGMDRERKRLIEKIQALGGDV